MFYLFENEKSILKENVLKIQNNKLNLKAFQNNFFKKNRVLKEKTFSKQKRFSNEFSKKNKFSMKKNFVTKLPFMQKCFRPKKEGFHVSKCVCHYCNKIGHFISDCLIKRNAHFEAKMVWVPKINHEGPKTKRVPNTT